MSDDNDQVDLTPALRTWAFKNGITPADFKERMGYKAYPHAWSVVSRKGNGSFSVEAWGKFIVAYGITELMELFRIAGVDPNFGGRQ